MLFVLAAALLLYQGPGAAVPSYTTSRMLENAGITQDTGGSIITSLIPIKIENGLGIADEYTRQKIAMWLERQQWGISPELIQIASSEIAVFMASGHPTFTWRDFCRVIWGESRWRIGAVGDRGNSFGLAQMHRPSWRKHYDFSRLGGHSLADGEYQLRVAMQHWALYGPSEWTVYRRMKKGYN